MAVGQETVIADALEARRKGVLQEAPDEFFGGNSHHLLWLLLVPVGFPGEGDLALFQRQEATVGDGHAMGVASQVFQHVLRTAEGGFGVNYPLLLFEGGPGSGQKLSSRAALPPRRRIGVGRRCKPLPGLPKTSGGTDGRAPSRAAGIGGGRESSDHDRQRSRRRGPCSADGDENASSAPSYAALRRSRVPPPDVSDRGPMVSRVSAVARKRIS